MEARFFLLNLMDMKDKSQLDIGTSFIEKSYDTKYPLITIDGIYHLLEDDKVLDKFIHFDENKDYFGKLSQKDIATSFMKFITLMKCQGMELSDAEKTRVDIIESYVPEYQRGRYIIPKEYSGIDSKEIFNTAMELLYSEVKFEEFLQSQQSGKLYHDISPKILTEYILESLRRCLEGVSISKQVHKALNFLYNKNSFLLNPFYKLDPEKKVDPEFEASVLQSIDKEKDPVDIALDTYNALNRVVEFNNNISALGQNFSYQATKDIYNLEFSKITKKKNKLICKQWAELYAYFLEKNGFDAYISGYGYHKKVIAFKGTTAILADASATKPSKYDDSFMKDITRSKIGVRPAGFIVCTIDGDNEAIMEIEPLKVEYEESEDSINEVKELLGQIRDADGISLSKTIMDLENPDNALASAMKKICFISHMMVELNMGNADTVDYANNLYMILLTDEEKEIAKMTNIFYQGFNTDKCSLVPIISLNIENTPPNASNGKYVQFIMDPESYIIKSVSHEELKDRVARGIYIQGLGERNKTIPGIPEITDPDWVVRKRAEYSMAKVGEKPNPFVIEEITQEE